MLKICKLCQQIKTQELMRVGRGICTDCFKKECQQKYIKLKSENKVGTISIKKLRDEILMLKAENEELKKNKDLI